MFEIPGSNISSVYIDEDVVLGKSGPKYIYSSIPHSEENEVFDERYKYQSCK